MAMFTVYFDTSGKPYAPGVMFSSGFVSTIGKWSKFEEEWLELLAEFGIKNPFHMTEFAGGHGQFSAWKDDLKRQNAFYNAAWSLIKRRVHKSFSHGVIISDFWRMHREYEIPPESPFFLTCKYPLTRCGVGAYREVHLWKQRQQAKGMRFDGEIEYIHDRGDEHRGALMEAMRYVFDIDVIFKDKSKVVSLQVADMLAWEHARAVGRVLIWEESVRRPDIFDHIPGCREWSVSKWAEMKDFCETLGFKKRNPASPQ